MSSDSEDLLCMTTSEMAWTKNASDPRFSVVSLKYQPVPKCIPYALHITVRGSYLIHGAIRKNFVQNEY